MSPGRETLVTIAVCVVVLVVVISLGAVLNKDHANEYQQWNKKCEALGGVVITAQGQLPACVKNLMDRYGELKNGQQMATN